MSKVYRNLNYPRVEIPNIDLLTFLFDSEHCLAEDEKILHSSADDPRRSLTKSQLNDLTQRIAYCLRKEFGIGSDARNQDVVTVMSYGQCIGPAAFFGVIAAGGIYSATSPSLTVDELIHQLRLTDSRVILCSIDALEVAEKAAASCGISPGNVLVLQSSPTWSIARSIDNINLITGRRLRWVTSTNERELEESVIMIVWSSGTTGVPKGVKLSHRNVVAQTYITHFQGRESAYKRVEQGTYEAKEFRTLAHLPASHISGLFGYFISAMYANGLVVWMHKYEWKQFLRYCKQFQITYLFTVPSIYLRIAKSPEVTDEFSSLMTATTGSAPMDASLQKAAGDRLGFASRSSVGSSWGLTEATGAITFTPDDVVDEPGSLGPILPNLEIRLVDDSFSDVSDGHPGELIVQGPTITKGYFNNPTATRASFHDGWFQTGDIAIRKNGKFFIVDRKKELLKYKGLQMFPCVFEYLLNSLASFQESAVIGIPSPRDPSTDLPRAYVVADSSKISAMEIKEFVKDRLAAHKQLRGGVVFVDEIPKNQNGKILRRELRDRAKVEVGDTLRASL